LHSIQSRVPPAHSYKRFYCRHCGFTVDAPQDCGHRFCPTCARRRAFRIRNRLTWLLNNNQPKTGFILKMITLSTSNCQDLDRGVRHLVSSFRKLRQRKIWKTHIDGGANIIEVKGRPGSWHPHLHVICWSRRIDWDDLRKAWTSVSGGLGCYIINTSSKSACFYVTKYITKPEVPQGTWEELGKVLVKYRLFQRFGSWHSLVIPKRVYEYACPKCSHTWWVPDWMVEQAVRRGG
jgi:hypothetical protein